MTPYSRNGYPKHEDVFAKDISSSIPIHAFVSSLTEDQIQKEICDKHSIKVNVQ